MLWLNILGVLGAQACIAGAPGPEKDDSQRLVDIITIEKQQNIIHQLEIGNEADVSEPQIIQAPDSTTTIPREINQEISNSYDWRTIAAITAVIVSILSLTITQLFTILHKNRDMRKSLYDDLLFREMFFKPFNSKLNSLLTEWSNFEKENISIEELEKFISEVSGLRDMTHPLEVLSPSTNGTLQILLDDLELLLSIEDNPEDEVKAKLSISKIYQLLINLQQEMMNKGFKIKSIK